MKKLFVAIVVILIISAFMVPVFIPEELPYLTNLQLVLSALITLFLPFTLLSLIFAAWVTKHLYIQLERMNIGGINLLFRKPDKLFLDSAKAFLETKRTLYKINGELDNFNETLDSYFSTYQFFKNEMSILDTTKEDQKKLYELSSKIIRYLNEFLTLNQNNYRRWYQKTIEENRVLIKGENEEKDTGTKAHMMRIGELQKYYYDYNQILKGFKDINTFFKQEVNQTIKVDINKWESDYIGETQNFH
ncbi:hypothetical protein HNR44_001875 [Geomicrobium halophilum]|uniref:5-bromo-4-chloroindolyl phosphate hydrolysis protein n=1 Tax=Geomicrobium halophilum TaxID=549000 RepID=A0A841PM24_9BACL|nr:hypothetical protein [Geomicrobium halophilum]MBB6449897.1 hypothetical protein [Geomicrobium halophilum]